MDGGMRSWPRAVVRAGAMSTGEGGPSGERDGDGSVLAECDPSDNVSSELEGWGIHKSSPSWTWSWMMNDGEHGEALSWDASSDDAREPEADEASRSCWTSAAW